MQLQIMYLELNYFNSIGCIAFKAQNAMGSIKWMDWKLRWNKRICQTYENANMIKGLLT